MIIQGAFAFSAVQRSPCFMPKELQNAEHALDEIFIVVDYYNAKRHASGFRFATNMRKSIRARNGVVRVVLHHATSLVETPDLTGDAGPTCTKCLRIRWQSSSAFGAVARH